MGQALTRYGLGLAGAGTALALASVALLAAALPPFNFLLPAPGLVLLAAAGVLDWIAAGHPLGSRRLWRLVLLGGALILTAAAALALGVAWLLAGYGGNPGAPCAPPWPAALFSAGTTASFSAAAGAALAGLVTLGALIAVGATQTPPARPRGYLLEASVGSLFLALGLALSAYVGRLTCPG